MEENKTTNYLERDSRWEEIQVRYTEYRNARLDDLKSSMEEL